MAKDTPAVSTQERPDIVTLASETLMGDIRDFLLDRLKRDQEYRARLNAQRASLWNKAAIVATLLGGAAGVAALVAVLLHL